MSMLEGKVLSFEAAALASHLKKLVEVSMEEQNIKVINKLLSRFDFFSINGSGSAILWVPQRNEYETKGYGYREIAYQKRLRVGNNILGGDFSSPTLERDETMKARMFAGAPPMPWAVTVDGKIVDEGTDNELRFYTHEVARAVYLRTIDQTGGMKSVALTFKGRVEESWASNPTDLW